MKKKRKTSRKSIIAFLLMLSLVLTSGTFAFWASYVEGAKEYVTGNLTVGSAQGVETTFELSNQLNSGGYLVPSSQVDNSNVGAVDQVDLSYNLQWLEDSDNSQLVGTKSTGKISITHHLIIESNGKVLPSIDFSEIYNLIKVNYDENNPSEMILDSEAELFRFSITMDEPSNQEEYNLIANAKVSVVFNFRIYDNFVETVDMIIEEDIVEEIVPPSVSFEFIGDEVVYLEVGENYETPWAKAYDSLGNEISNIWYTGSFNSWEIGTYTIQYGAYSSYDNETVYSAERTIIVQDTTAPVITLNGSYFMVIRGTQGYSDWGAWAQDNSNESIEIEVDGIEEVNESTYGLFVVTYTATDSSGNQSQAYRYVFVR